MCTSGGGSTTTQNNDPWSAQQPYLKDLFSQAQDLEKSGNLAVGAYPSSTYFAPTAAQQAGQSMALGTAYGLQPVAQTAQQNLAKTLNGDYLSPQSNPYLDQTYNYAANKVRDSVMSQFEQGGRTGSGANQDTLAYNLGNLANQIYGGNYQTERARQDADLNNFGSIASGLQSPAQQVMGVGDIQQQQGQEELNAAINQWTAAQTQPVRNLEEYMRLIQGQYGGTSSSSTQQQSNPLASLLGVASTGAGIAKLFM